MKRRVQILFIIFFATVLPEHSFADESDWSFSLGGAALSFPLYEGDDEHGLAIFPVLSIDYKEIVKLSLNDGARVNIASNDRFDFGTVLKYHFGRDPDQDNNPFIIFGKTEDLNGLDKIDPTAEGGFFLSLKHDSAHITSEIRKGLGGGHKGLVGQLSFSLSQWMGPLMISPSIDIEYKDREYAQTFFGITDDEAARSQLNEYNIGSGSVSYGSGLFLMAPIFNSTTIKLIWQFKRLGEKIRNSPLVVQRGSPNQSTVGILISYSWSKQTF